MNKILSSAKIALLVCTLAVLAFGFIPSAADAAPGDITVICDGGDELCVTYEDPDVIIEFYFGNPIAVIIELD